MGELDHVRGPLRVPAPKVTGHLTGRAWTVGPEVGPGRGTRHRPGTGVRMGFRTVHHDGGAGGSVVALTGPPPG